MANYDIIIKPVLSEKSYADIANKKYVFKVAKSAKVSLDFFANSLTPPWHID